MLNRTCTRLSGERSWESNVILSVVHMSTAAPYSVLFVSDSASFSTHSNSSTVTEACDIVG